MNRKNLWSLKGTVAAAIALICVCMSGPLFAKKTIIIERIVAVVNGEIILWSEWKQQVELNKARIPKSLDDDDRKKKIEEMKKQIIDKMINDKLILQSARKLSVRVTSKEVDAAVKDTRKRYNMSASQFLQALAEQGYTMPTYKAMVRRELMKLRLLQRVLRQKIRVSEEDIRKYYADMTRGVNKGAREYRVRQILIPVAKGAAADVVKTQRKAASALLKKAQAQKGLKAFVKLVKKHSKGPWKEKDGDLGYMATDSLPKAIADVATKLKLKQVYPKLLRSALGFHIVYLQATRLEGILSYKEARPKILKKLQQIAFRKEYTRYIKDLRRKAVIDMRLDLKKKKKK